VTDRFLAISDLITLSDAGVWGVDAESGGISILRSTNFRADGEISFDNLEVDPIDGTTGTGFLVGSSAVPIC
jgi:hypothetical protein